MLIEDKFIIAAPIREVWDFFLDIPTVSACVPGAEKVEQIDDETFAGTLVVKVGPIKANFNGQAILKDVVPPQRLIATAQGKDKNTSSMVSATFTALLTEMEPGRTEVAHQVEVAIRGRLGQFGQGVIRETAKQLTKVFVTCVETKITAQAAALKASTIPSGADTNEADASHKQATPAHAQSSAPPSLLSIIFKSFFAAISNWFRTLRSGPVKPVE